MRIGSDQTTEVILDDAGVHSASAFDLGELERMTPADVIAFERRVLASCGTLAAAAIA